MAGVCAKCGDVLECPDCDEAAQAQATATNSAMVPCPSHCEGKFCVHGHVQWHCDELPCEIARHQ